MPDFNDRFENDQYTVTRLEFLPDSIAHLILDNPASSANVMTDQLQKELDRRADQLLANSSDIRALLVSTAKPKIFIAGADIKSIAATSHFSKDQVLHFCRRGQTLYQRYASMPFPTIGLIHGACVGGGLEFALALDWRIASDHRATIIGLPEVHLGLVPGWAATARVPRLTSIQTALELIGGGVNVSSVEAHRLGLVDEIGAEEDLQQAAIDRLAHTESGWQDVRREMLRSAPRKLMAEDPSDLGIDRAKAKHLGEKVLADLFKAQPSLNSIAPTLVVSLILDGIGKTLEEACELEAIAMSKVYCSNTGQSLVNSFLLNDRSNRSPGLCKRPSPSPEIRRLGIVGMGLMGTSIAKMLESSPWEIVLYDTKTEVTARLVEDFPNTEKYSIAKSLDDLADCDVVLENVFERLDVKQSLLRQFEICLPKKTVLLSNTSVIPMECLAAELEDSSRFCGLHFFNPIKQTKLAEVTRHGNVGDATLWTAHLIARQLRKSTIVVGDGPGLVVNRLLSAFLNEGQCLLAEGWSIAEIDKAATDFGWRLGPFQILDVIGLPTALDAGYQISAALGETLQAPPFLVPMIKAKRYGQQSGHGFYLYDRQGQRHEDPSVYQVVDAYRHKTAIDEKPDLQWAANRMAMAMVGQGLSILKAKQVSCAKDIDLCTLLALGFPADKGGLLFWADHFEVQGLSEQSMKADGSTRLVETVTSDDPGFYDRFPE